MSSIQIIESHQSFRRKVLLEMARRVNKIIYKAVPKIASDVRFQIGNLFRADSVYSDISTGPLGAMLGLSPTLGKSGVESVVNAIIANMQFNYTQVSLKGSKLSGGLDVGVLQSDFRDVLSLPQATYSSNGIVIPWLEWLLLRGDQIIISGHSIEFGNFDDSRSGIAIMIDDKQSAWRIPPEYSGIVNDNWLTRTIDNNMRLVSSIISDSIERHIKAQLNAII